jgi:hypothetical protein
MRRHASILLARDNAREKIAHFLREVARRTAAAIA